MITALGIPCREMWPGVWVGVMGNVTVHVTREGTNLGPLYRVIIARTRDLEPLSKGIGVSLESAASSAEHCLRVHAEERLGAYDTLSRKGGEVRP